MKTKRIGMALAAIMAVSLTAGCTKVDERETVSNEPGSLIVFGASAEWQNDSGTRTEYSGKDENNDAIDDDSKYERIDWVDGKDLIRILCDAAEPKVSGAEHAANYVISGVRPDASAYKKSLAGIVPADDNSLHWGTQTHYFYALYPAPGMESNYDFTDKTVQAANSKIESVTGNKAKITGVVPSTQNAVKVGNTYKPNMNYAYMYAATQAMPGQSGRVLLSFNPLVTTLEFSLKGDASDPIPENLTSLELSSTSTPLTGQFEATINGTVSTPSVSITAPSFTAGTNDKITITLPSPGVQLSDTPVKFTFLTLPVDQMDLMLTLHFADDSKRTLLLKNLKSGKVSAMKKAYFDLTAPGTIPYTLEVQGPSTSTCIAAGGGTVTYYVKSYKRSNSGANVGAGWTAEFSENGGQTWVSSKPSWLTTFTVRDANGSVPSKSYTATASANNSNVDKTWHGDTQATGHDTKATARNVSHYDVYGNSLSSPSGYTDAISTANCYVVSEPGWYKIPAVYGNSFKNGKSNPDAYSFGGSMRQGGFRHDGNPITDPWISENGFDIKGYGSARVLWQDAPNLVQNVKVYNSDPNPNFIYFEVPATIQQGNALIALAINGVIVWSWHIWVIEKEKLGTTTVSNSSSVENPVKMMNVNLGWYDAAKINVPRSVRVRVTQDGSGKQAEFVIYQTSDHGYGGNVVYQWGRKDPMLGFSEYYAEKTQYSSSNSDRFQLGNGSQSYAESIKHPNIYYKGATNWMNSRYLDPWNKSATFDADKKVVKTVYDPCPVGFKVPNMKAFNVFSTTWTIGPYMQGYLFKASSGDTKGILFPITPVRSWYDAAVEQNSGHYFTAAQTWWNGEIEVNGYSPYYLEFSEDVVTPLGHTGVTAFGMTIRPIVDD